MFVSIAGLCSTALAADDSSPDKVSFFRDIRPILQDRCQGCHQPAKPQGDLVLTSYADVREGGESDEPTIVPGSQVRASCTSRSRRRIATTRSCLRMRAAAEASGRAHRALDCRRGQRRHARFDQGGRRYGSSTAVHRGIGRHVVRLLARWQVAGDQRLPRGADPRRRQSPGDETVLVSRLVGLSERIESAVFSPDGKKLAVTGGSPGRFGEVQIWNVAKKKLLLSVPVTYDTIYGASWSSDGSKVAFGCADNTVRIIDAATGKQILYQGAHSDWHSTRSSRSTTHTW